MKIMKMMERLMKRKKHFMMYYAVICFVITLIVSSFGLISYNKSNNLLASSVRSRLTSNLETASLHIDADVHNAIRTTYMDQGFAGDTSAGKTDQRYIDTVDSLRQFGKAVKAEFIYTINWSETHNSFYYTLDTDDGLDDQGNKTNDIYVGLIYEGLDDEDLTFFKQSLTNPDIVYINEVNDEFGSHMTGIKALTRTIVDPLDNTKEISVIETIVCVDITTEYIRSLNISFITTTSLLFVTLMAAFLIIGVFLYKMLKRNSDMQDKIEQMAYYDSLTTLPNRASLVDHLHELTETQNNSRQFAVVFIDIDNFKKVNDSEGHIEGDILLQKIAKFLKTRINLKPRKGKPYPIDYIARLGGDEFVIVYRFDEDIELKNFLEKTTEDFKVLAAQDNIIPKYSVSLSLGASVYPQDGSDTSTLLKTADLAMYSAKRTGKGKSCIYTKDLEKIKKEPIKR